MIARGKIVDLCPGGVDLGFTVTTTVTITLEGTQIRVEKENSKNLDNLDTLFCVLGTLGLALLAAVAAFAFGGITIASGVTAVLEFGFIGVLTSILAFEDEDFALVFGDGEDDKPTIIQLDFPIPGTDLLPTLTGNFIRVDESTMLMAAQLGTRQDDLNTYFYMRFMEPHPRSPTVLVTRPVTGARTYRATNSQARLGTGQSRPHARISIRKRLLKPRREDRFRSRCRTFTSVSQRPTVRRSIR